MKTAIVSDIHGNLAALEAVLEDIEQVGVDRIVSLGDVIGYGPNPNECLDHVMDFEFSILGNHDSSALFDPEGFNVTAEQAIFWTREQLESPQDGSDAGHRRMEYLCQMPRSVEEEGVLFVHGSPRGPTNEYVFPEDVQNPKKMDKLFSLFSRICFQGHTHVPGIFSADHRFVRPSDIADRFSLAANQQSLMINVGSVGQPRDGDSRSCYVIHDGESIEFRRVEYDIEKTVGLIESIKQLDDFLGHRLRDGK
jgi:predicted phosphodiesterase